MLVPKGMCLGHPHEILLPLLCHRWASWLETPDTVPAVGVGHVDDGDVPYVVELYQKSLDWDLV